jgi:hypothetical protein
MDKVRDVAIKVRNDWNVMKEEERVKKEGLAKKDLKPYDIPSFKKGGTVKKTGLIYAHKGERVIPKNKVSKMFKKGR